MLDSLELAPVLRPTFKLFPHPAGTRLPHAPLQSRLQDRALILDRCPFKDVLAGVGHGLLRDLGRVDLLCTLIAERTRHHPIGLVPVLGRQLTMPVQHLGR